MSQRTAADVLARFKAERHHIGQYITVIGRTTKIDDLQVGWACGVLVRNKLGRIPCRPLDRHEKRHTKRELSALLTAVASRMPLVQKAFAELESLVVEANDACQTEIPEVEESGRLFYEWCQFFSDALPPDTDAGTEDRVIENCFRRAQWERGDDGWSCGEADERAIMRAAIAEVIPAVDSDRCSF